jgi:Uma2 family endonuclease
MAAQPTGAVAGTRTAGRRTDELGAPAPATTAATAAAVRSAPAPRAPAALDLPDEAYSEYAPPVVESERNGVLRAELIERLRLHFRADPDVNIWGDLGIYYHENHPRRFVAPDVFVARGVPARPPRRVYLTWREGKFPDLVLELVSPRTFRRDRGPKRRLYAELGAREYFLFDLQGDMLIPPLQGFRLADGVHEAIPPTPAGGLYSEVLHLELRDVRRPDGERWLFPWDPQTGTTLPTLAEAAEARAAAEAEARRAAEAEVERLRAALAQRIQ